MRQSLTYLEIETPPWVATSPMGPDVTWRFVKPALYRPRSIQAIDSLIDVSMSPAIISLGKDLGQRGTVTARLRDHKHIMGAEPYESGSHWGKWRARYGTRLRGRPMRLIFGLVGQALEDMETWHFVIESTDGPTPDGIYTITGQDVLKLASDDRALAPRPTNGFLISSIANNATAAVLGPAGIGNAQYEASGYINFGGKEVCAFTRSNDNLTLTRTTTIPGTTYETEVVAHAAGTRAQQCLAYDGDDMAVILADLFVNFAGIPADYVPLETWEAETEAFLKTVYTTLICEPTGVAKLASELIAQSASATWWDALQRQMRLQVLRAIPTSAARFDESTILAGSLGTQEQPAARLSEVLTYFGLRNPLKPIEQADNYRSALLTPDPEAETAYGGNVNKTIYSRWIAFGGLTIAERLNLILLSRFRDPPRRFTFNLFRYGPQAPQLGGGYQVGWSREQDMDGAAVLAPIQITQLNPRADVYAVEAEEMLYTPLAGSRSLNERVIIIDSDINNINLREIHDDNYAPLTAGDLTTSPPTTVQFIIQPNVRVGSISTGLPAIDLGDWSIGLVPRVTVRGRVSGRGGRGGDGGIVDVGDAGSIGGPALYARYAFQLEDADGETWGGAGGGAGGHASGATGGSGGGGGAGRVPGTGGTGQPPSGLPGTSGSDTAGGPGGAGSGSVKGGNGGGPGLFGQSVTGSAGTSLGGSPGAAIDGVSFMSQIGPAGDRRGPEIN